jgi:endonuclease/exonuclease/phosphatase family metal-dependent hydrolase
LSSLERTGREFIIQMRINCTGNTLPAPVVIGSAGRVPPSEVIEDDNFAEFDPQNDGVDFYESLEAMRVTLQDAVAVSPTNKYGEIFALANQGADASGRNTRGGITIQPSDFNPERVQINFDSGILDFYATVDSGDLLGDVTGVVGYDFGNFEIYPTEPLQTESAALPRETSDLRVEGEHQVTVAGFNVLNLDPNDEDGDQDVAKGRFERLAGQIVDNLHAPDIIALQEIQDNSGALDDATVDADITLEMLVDAIVNTSGPYYKFIDYIAGRDYMYDDRGHTGGLPEDARFVIMGDLNADPNDGDSTGEPTLKLLASPQLNTAITPVSLGGAEAAIRQGGANLDHLGGAAFDTADFADSTPGNLRSDYVLPSRNLEVQGAGIFWPSVDDPLFALVGDYPFPSSDHRLVWVDLMREQPKQKHKEKHRR